MSSKPGGLKPSQPVTDEVRDAANECKSDIEAKAGRTFTTFNPVEYSSQVVAGTNYYIKIDVGNNEYILARIWRQLSGQLSVHSVKTGLTADDPITYIQ